MQHGDWHPADVLAALKKKGYHLATLSVDAGYDRTAAGKALRKRWSAMESVIADAIGVPPATIWPSRYDENGLPLPKRQPKGSMRRRRRNVRSQAAE